MANSPLPTYGGQAVIEGVMMRGGQSVAIAMRAPDGVIRVHTEQLSGIYRAKWAKLPFLRGLVILWDALGLGMRALTISANVQGEEDDVKLEGPALYLTLGASLAFAVLLFFMLPATAGHFTGQWLNAGPWVANLAEGIVRLVILIGYIWSIGRMEDIKRVYRYHGAEHKTINAFEAGAELTPESVAKFPLEHPRCGTAFLLTVVIFSILLFSLLGPMPSLAVRLLTRLALIPVLASLAYEYIRWTANHLGNPLVRLLIKPNLALQRLTTAEPDAAILEVAIKAFEEMRRGEQPQVV
ncbi:MAG: DUF1385 domain-containing protein [Anaerolineae bacterium]|nr:MAG: DUF1385 domain-containing protein [Anaerolineae bacterium]